MPEKNNHCCNLSPSGDPLPALSAGPLGTFPKPIPKLLLSEPSAYLCPLTVHGSCAFPCHLQHGHGTPSTLPSVRDTRQPLSPSPSRLDSNIRCRQSGHCSSSRLWPWPWIDPFAGPPCLSVGLCYHLLCSDCSL